VITAFALLCDRCGLSHREAADFLRVRIDTVKSWSAGRNPTPAGALEELRGLWWQIQAAAAEDVAIIERQPQPPVEIELGLASDDHEARALGWPCVGAHAAVLGTVVAGVAAPVRIVPRGSTPATAAAAEVRDR
jgi:hypothetical protein